RDTPSNASPHIVDPALMQPGSSGRTPHNLFLAGDPGHWWGSMAGCISVVYPPKVPGDAIEVFNNVFDGGNRLDVPGIEVCPGGAVKSVRNNVFFNFAHSEKYHQGPQAAIRTTFAENPSEEKPARPRNADCNPVSHPAAKHPP